METQHVCANCKETLNSNETALLEDNIQVFSMSPNMAKEWALCGLCMNGNNEVSKAHAAIYDMVG
jgi:hypothetical protein